VKSPVLFLVFNRPSTTSRVFEAIRQARPPRLYVAADGPRADRPAEARACADVRRIATAVDWPCEVSTLLRDTNLGCRLGVSQGIDWFFEQEPEGVVLEDDVLPLPGFFTYCDELLERHRDDARVASVSGCSLIADRYRAPHSYFYSRQDHVWGWAGWRRSWRHYDVAMATWPEWDRDGGLLRLLDGDRCAADYWSEVFNRAWRGEVDTWDYQWKYACWSRGLLHALPQNNLTLNLGLGAGATHTRKVPSYVKRNPPRALRLPLSHPPRVERDGEADRLIQRHVTGLTYLRCLKRSMRRLLAPQMAEA
jgi:hypothetical protein